MKRNLLLFILIFVVFGSAFAQRIPSVGVMVFEVYGAGVTAAEAVTLTNSVVSELSSWGTLNVSQGSAGAEFVIRATISRQGNSYVLDGVTVNTSTEQTVSTYREQIEITNPSLFAFCAKAVERVPFPNYLLGTWQSTLTMPDGPVVCIIEFRSDRTVRVERYDTWEHKQNNALRYEGYGSGTYFYAGYANRVINVDSRQVRVDATFSVNLSLEETLPDQTAVNLNGLSLVFNGDKSAFEIVNGTLPCGTNYDGPSVYPSSSLGFQSFTKVR